MDGVHVKRHQSDADAGTPVCEQRTHEMCIRARYRTIYGRLDIVRLMNLRSISRYRVIDIITSRYCFSAEWCGDGAGNTVEENCSIFSLIRMR